MSLFKEYLVSDRCTSAVAAQNLYERLTEKGWNKTWELAADGVGLDLIIDDHSWTEDEEFDYKEMWRGIENWKYEDKLDYYDQSVMLLINALWDKDRTKALPTALIAGTQHYFSLERITDIVNGKIETSNVAKEYLAEWAYFYIANEYDEWT